MALSQRIARHLRANVIAYVALFVALGGTAIALPGKNKVKSNDLARGAVEGRALAGDAVGRAKVRPGAITSAAIADRSVVNADLGDAVVTTPKLVDEAVARAKIAAGAINGGKLANGSVNSAKVNDGSLQAADFAPGQLSEGFVSGADPASFNLPRPGRLFVTVTLVPTCPTPPCTYEVRTDGTAVPGTDLSSAATGDQQLTLTGVSDPLSAGSRSVDVVQTGAGATFTELTIAAVLLQ